MNKKGTALAGASAAKNKAVTRIVAQPLGKPMEKKITAKLIRTCNAMAAADSSIRKAHQARGGYQGATRRQFRQWMKKEGYSPEEQKFFLIAYGYDAGGEA